MLINWLTPRHRNIGIAQYSSVQVWVGGIPIVTMEDLLECCETNYAVLLEILRFIKQQGFRREKISREELQRQNMEILAEIREMKRQLRYSGGPK